MNSFRSDNQYESRLKSPCSNRQDTDLSNDDGQ